jgi:hypothetical protein
VLLTYFIKGIQYMPSAPITPDQIQQSVASTIGTPQGSVPQGEGPIDPNGPPWAPAGTPGVSNPLPVPSTLVRQQQAQQQAAAADVAHHALLGKGVKSLFDALNNRQTKYVADPATGQVVEQQVRTTPGGFFRNLIGGMLLGSAAGAQNPAVEKDGRVIGGNNIVGGFGRGFSANLQNQQAQDEQQYKRAQDQVRNEQERQRQVSDDTMHEAQIAHMNAEIVGLQQNLHHADQEMIDRRNASARAYEKSLQDSGAIPYKFTVNGEQVDSMSASDLAKAFTTDPSIARAAPGYERHFIDITDASGLNFDGKYWRNDAGEAVNMSDKTQIKAYDMPTKTMKTFEQTPGSEINALAGDKIVDPNHTYSINGDGKLALRTLGLKNDAAKARAVAAEARADKTAKNARIYTQIEAKKASALAKAEHDFWTAVNKSGDPEHPSADLVSQLNTAKQNAQDAYENEIRAAGGSAQHFQYSNANPQTTTPTQKTFSPSKWRAANPNGDVNAATAEAKRQNMTITQ